MTTSNDSNATAALTADERLERVVGAYTDLFAFAKDYGLSACQQEANCGLELAAFIAEKIRLTLAKDSKANIGEIVKASKDLVTKRLSKDKALDHEYKADATEHDDGSVSYVRTVKAKAPNYTRQLKQYALSYLCPNALTMSINACVPFHVFVSVDSNNGLSPCFSNDRAERFVRQAIDKGASKGWTGAHSKKAVDEFLASLRTTEQEQEAKSKAARKEREALIASLVEQDTEALSSMLALHSKAIDVLESLVSKAKAKRPAEQQAA